ncbi:SPP1 family predicted phage head-tail adaptor [Anaerosolibacter carboniphilus]|uniref:SPP1 family predicted phage head-tail adaptor n=1 Tax=Anaerosolibacter carboniphilus TaxID=1417629 RepID=A0A841KXU9_9FIRM|nr:phage head closure protein [Anaerosolibacter carboniphilus]MBB6214965.1 SPP1 family predicted phage head-tail adaptor [Anaerosolibacter carboniphilus]
MLKSREEKTKELLTVTDTKIEVWGREEFKNELKETAYRDKSIKTIWAKVIPQTGKLQSQAADTKLSNVSHKILVRYGAGKDITQDMHFKVRGNRFDIKYILNPYYADEWLEIFCEEIIE